VFTGIIPYVDEKVTVISIFPEIAHFFGTEAGNALAAIGNIHEGDSHKSYSQIKPEQG